MYDTKSPIPIFCPFVSLSSLKSNYRVSNATKAFTLKISPQKEERLRPETAICYQYHFSRSRSEGTSSISFKREPLLKNHHFTAITFTDVIFFN